MRDPGCTRRSLACQSGWLGPSAGVSGGYQPGFVGEYDGLDPIVQRGAHYPITVRAISPACTPG